MNIPIISFIPPTICPKKPPTAWSPLDNSSSFIAGSNEFHFNNKTDEKEDFLKIQQDLDYNLGFLKSIQAKLNNKRFVDNAPKNVLDNELKKEKDALSKIEILKNKLKNN